MNWCEDLKITYTCAKRIAEEKFDKTLSIFEFEDMIEGFKKKQVVGFTDQEIEILVEEYVLNNKKHCEKKEKSNIKFSKEELIYLHELLGYLDYHLMEHIFLNSEYKDKMDILAIGMRLFNKIDRELNKKE